MVNHILYVQHTEKTFETVDHMSFMICGSRYYFGTHRLDPQALNVAYFRRDNDQDGEVTMIFNEVVKLNWFDKIFKTTLMKKAIDTGRVVRNEIIKRERNNRIEKHTGDDGRLFDLQSERLRRKKT